MNDVNDAPFVDKPKRNPNRWKDNKSKGDKWANRAKKAWKQRERELDDEDDERLMREYK